ncbi:gene transfer agent family protein [Yoonia sediminilitoris]|uniref:Tail tube GTA-gp10-like protein n=1 Tax=Yoonia sediminilitoris TaxID=1286148 RepID=A0A2T6KDR7_9RHOB|nr:gene transfer agent family protein [Yoonia sediminilitoris]PUB13127.1 tail tube GTA-gp10-like protein [Yoonia sediminilitoris]RCW94462.1 tail tube GTA-gp10-like protein [Yoonia sediminilitoris]
MTNPMTGEVSLTIDGQAFDCKLTLGALAALETGLGDESLIDLIRRFETSAFSSRDVMAVVIAGLHGGGWTGNSDDLMTAKIEGGPVEAAKAAALMLARAFTPPI